MSSSNALEKNGKRSDGGTIPRGRKNRFQESCKEEENLETGKARNDAVGRMGEGLFCGECFNNGKLLWPKVLP